MKPLLLLLVSLLLACQHSSTQAAAPESDTAVATEEKAVVVANASATFQIDGMMCEVGCKGTIEKALNNTAGVSECVVDFEKAQAAISFDSLAISTDEITGIINTLADGHYSATLL